MVMNGSSAAKLTLYVANVDKVMFDVFLHKKGRRRKKNSHCYKLKYRKVKNGSSAAKLTLNVANIEKKTLYVSYQIY